MRVLAALTFLLATAGMVLAAPVPVRQARDCVRRGDARGLLDLVRQRYGSLESIAVSGEGVTRASVMGQKMVTTTKYVARATREGRYLVRWAAPVTTLDGASPGAGFARPAGAVWNDGTGAFNYVDAPAAWAKAASDDAALGLATGLSGGATELVFLLRVTPSLGSLAALESPVIEDSESIDGSPCWVVSGSTPVTSRMVVWISRTQLLVRRLSRSMTPPPGREPPPLMQGSIDDAIREAGLEPTPEMRQRFAMMMEMAKVMRKHAGALDGEMMGTFHVDAVDRPLGPADLAFEVPAGTPFKRSLLEDALDQMPGRPQ